MIKSQTRVNNEIQYDTARKNTKFSVRENPAQTERRSII